MTTITVSSNLKLSPPSAAVLGAANIAFTATLSTAVTGTVQYDWSQSGSSGAFHDNNGHFGTSFTSPSNNVTLTTTVTDNNVTVTVQAFVVNPNGTRTSLGTATSSVIVTHKTKPVTATGSIKCMSLRWMGFSHRFPRQRLRGDHLPQDQGRNLVRSHPHPSPTAMSAWALAPSNSP